MGRIKNRLIKRSANDLLARYRDRFTTNFEDNKKVLGEVARIESKKIRNVLAGYLTKIMKQVD